MERGTSIVLVCVLLLLLYQCYAETAQRGSLYFDISRHNIDFKVTCLKDTSSATEFWDIVDKTGGIFFKYAIPDGNLENTQNQVSLVATKKSDIDGEKLLTIKASQHYSFCLIEREKSQMYQALMQEKALKLMFCVDHTACTPNPNLEKREIFDMLKILDFSTGAISRNLRGGCNFFNNNIKPTLTDVTVTVNIRHTSPSFNPLDVPEASCIIYYKDTNANGWKRPEPFQELQLDDTGFWQGSIPFANSPSHLLLEIRLFNKHVRVFMCDPNCDNRISRQLFVDYTDPVAFEPAVLFIYKPKKAIYGAFHYATTVVKDAIKTFPNILDSIIPVNVQFPGKTFSMEDKRKLMTVSNNPLIYEYTVYAHEIGHLFSYILEKPVEIRPELSQTHKLCDTVAQDNHLSWSEGYAHAFAYILQDTIKPVADPKLVGISIEKYTCHLHDASHDEGRTLAALWDLYDEHDDGDNNIDRNVGKFDKHDGNGNVRLTPHEVLVKPYAERVGTLRQYTDSLLKMLKEDVENPEKYNRATELLEFNYVNFQ